ncbi:MAG: hypothetical protein EHM58_03965 [Ignavibacteriae bacterium]|nr:MAG: hypothetical protein EHM58_03965 [Ignavibacteriota bacterium]
MKKYIFVVILNSIYVLSAFSQAEIPVVYKDYVNFNENSKRIKEAKIHVRTEVSQVEGKQDTLRVCWFDAGGNLAKEYRYSKVNGKDTLPVKNNYSYVYGTNGMLIQKIDSSGAEVVKFNIYYDDIGTITQEREYNAKGKKVREVNYEYDDLSRLVEANEVNYIDNCKTTALYEYDSYNNVAKHTLKKSCPGSESVTSAYQYFYKYDNKYNIIEKQSIFPDKTFKTETFQYDNNGNIVKSYESISKDEYNEYAYYYDKLNNRIKTEKKEVTGLFYKSYTEETTYDEKGALIETRITGPDEKVVLTKKFVYEYY